MRTVASVTDETDYLRFADDTHSIRPNHLKRLVLLEISRIKSDCRYLPTGTLRRSSSEKFIRKVTWFCAFCASAVSIGINAAMRLASGARPTLSRPPAAVPSCFSDHIRGLSATKESPFAVYADTMMWLSK